MPIRPVPLVLLTALVFPGSTLHAQTLPSPRAMPPADGPLPPPAIKPPPVILAPPGVVMPVMPPAGRPIPVMPLAASPYPPPGYRPSAYQVWQNYGVVYNGWMRPRVIQVTDGGYFFYNGAPYPYVYVHPGRHFGSIAPAGPAGP